MVESVQLKAKDSRALEEFVTRVRRELGEQVAGIRLFGSKARGDDTGESDIDVLVVTTEESVSLEDIVVDIAFDVNVKHDVYISPRVVGRAILDDPVWKITPFLRAIAREGIPL